MLLLRQIAFLAPFAVLLPASARRAPFDEDSLHIGLLLPFYGDGASGWGTSLLASSVHAHLEIGKQRDPPLRNFIKGCTEIGGCSGNFSADEFIPSSLPIRNPHPDVFKLKLHLDDVRYSQEAGALASIDRAYGSEVQLEHPMNAVIAGSTDDNTAMMASIFGAMKVVQVNFLAPGSDLSDKSQYPYLLRTISSTEQTGVMLWDYIQYFSWRGANIVYEDNLENPYASVVRSALASSAGVLGRADDLSAHSIPRRLEESWEELATDAAGNAASLIRASHHRLIIPIAYADWEVNRVVRREFKKAGLVSPKYQYMTTVSSVIAITEDTLEGHTHWHGYMLAFDFTDAATRNLLAGWYQLSNEELYARLPDYDVDDWSPPFTATLPDNLFKALPAFFTVILDLHASLHTLVQAFSDMLNDGFRPAEIHGEKLLSYVKRVNFTAFGKDYIFNEFQDMVAPALLQYLDTYTGGRLPWVTFARWQDVGGVGVTTPLLDEGPIWATGTHGWTPPEGIAGCLPGSILVQSGADDLGSCVVCPGGRFSDSYNARECVTCPGGTFSMPGSENCTLCDPGSFAAEESFECTQCFSGQYSSERGLSECEPCPTGRYSSARGQLHCEECPPGQAAPNTLSAQCSPCSTGEMQPASGQAQCEQCQPGTYQDQTSATACKSCQPGSFSAEIGQADCEQCRPGFYQPNETSRHPCARCEVGFYMAESGASSCRKCEFGTTMLLGAESDSTCVCAAGTFFFLVDEASAPRCLPCNEFMEACEGGNGAAYQRAGYHVTPDASHVYRCISDDACPSALLGTCPRGSSGRGCAECDAGSYYWNGEKCVECSEANTMLLITFPIVALALLFLTYWLGNDPIGKSLSRTSEFLVLGGLSMSVLFFFSSFAAYSIDWKEPMDSIISTGTRIASEIVTVQVACSLAWSPAENYAVTSAMPCVVVFCCVLLARLGLATGVRLFNTAATMMYAIFLLLILYALRPFRFIIHPLGSGKSLHFAPPVFEGSSQHAQMMVVGIAVLLLYCAPFTAACTWASVMIGRGGKVSRRRWLLRAYRFLFYKFQPHAYYWGVVILARNFAYAIAPSLWPEHPRVALCFLTVVSVVSAVLTWGVAPWRARWMTVADVGILVYLACILGLCMAWVDQDDSSDGALATVFALVALVASVVAVGFIIRVLVQFVCATKQRREEMRQKLEEMQQSHEDSLIQYADSENIRSEVADALDSLTRLDKVTPKFKDSPSLAPAILWVAQHQVDLEDVAHMAEQLRDKDYSLQCFFDDCAGIFPELQLYSVTNGRPAPLLISRTSSLSARSSRGGSSDSPGRQEHQRTFAALGAVYWICRLDIDGKQGLSFGVKDSDHHIVKPLPQDIRQEDLKGLVWGAMTPDQRRAHFYWNFDWALAASLFEQCGVSSTSSGQIKLDCRPEGRLVALLCLTAFHDIMKNDSLSPRVEETPYEGFEVGEMIHDHDLALAYLLDRHPDTLPSFRVLSPEQQRVVRFTQGELGFNAGWLVQAEGPPSALLSKFKKAITNGSANDSDVAFYFSHWLTDVAGAEPSPYAGSEKFAVKFPPHVLQGLLSCFSTVKALAYANETEVYEQYLIGRWKEESATLGPLPKGPGSVMRLRLVCMGQQAAAPLLEALDWLSPEDYAILAREMAETGLPDQYFSEWASETGPKVGPPFLAYYGPAWCQRMGQQNPELCLKVLAEAFRAARRQFPKVACQGQSTSSPGPQHRTVHLGGLKTVPVSVVEAAMEAGDAWFDIVVNNNLECTLRVKDL